MQNWGQRFRRGKCVPSRVRSFCPLSVQHPPPHPFVRRFARRQWTSRQGREETAWIFAGVCGGATTPRTSGGVGEVGNWLVILHVTCWGGMVEHEVGEWGGRGEISKLPSPWRKGINDPALSPSHVLVHLFVCSLSCLHAKAQNGETDALNLFFIPRFCCICELQPTGHS